MYSKENVRQANKLFFLLLKKGELKEKEDAAIFRDYLSSEGIRELLDVISEESDCIIKMIGDSIYLLPSPHNEIIGFDYRTSELGTTLKDSYLGFLIMTVIFAEFTNELEPAKFLNVIDIMELVSESFERAMMKNDIEEKEAAAGINLLELEKLWSSKPKWNEGTKKKQDTVSWDFKMGVIRKVVLFLKINNLVHYYSSEDKIYPTERFNNLMLNHFINNDRKAMIEKLLSEQGEIICPE